MSKRYRYNYRTVPDDPEQNAKWRAKTLELCSEDTEEGDEFRRKVMRLCRDDFWYWAKGFAFVHETRILDDDTDLTDLNTQVPFLPWPHQVPVVDRILKVLGKRDLRVVKSRAQGASWLLVLIFAWMWLFHKGFKGNLVSKDEQAVDRKNDMDSLLGKALTLDTPVLTTGGWVANGDLSVGDEVVGSDGRPTKVLAVHDRGLQKVYRVSFSDGSFVRCSGDHLWTVTTRKDRLSKLRATRDECPTVTLTTREMAESVTVAPGGPHAENTSGYKGVTRTKTGWRAKIISAGEQIYLGVYGTPGEAHQAYLEARERYRPEPEKTTRQHNYQAPLPAPVDFEGSGPLPIPPYSLGALLGDGCLSKTSIEIAGVDEEVFSRMRAELPECTFTDQPGGYLVVGGDLSRRVRDLGLRGKRAWEKHVPDQYLLASKDDRLALLQGLMDTDGTVCSGYGSFTSTSERLAKDVVFLVRSLGGRATEPKARTTSYTHCGRRKEGRVSYRTSITAPFSLFHLSRKASQQVMREPRDKVIVSIEPDGEEFVRCITVDAEDHLYVTDGFVLTHNCDWLLDKLPPWMVGKKGTHWFRSYESHTLSRADGETSIAGYACTQDVASGGRCLVFGVDEHAKHPRPQDREAMASTQPISRCRIFISTPKGQDGEFFKIVHDETIEEPVLYLDWRENPTQNRGLYRLVKGMPVAVDEGKYGPLPAEYLDQGKWVRLRSRLEDRGYDMTSERERSPWYDQECLRAGANPTLVAQEYDMHFGASEARYFSESLVNRLLNQINTIPVRGEFQVDPEQLVGYWVDNPDGRLKLWVELDSFNRPPMGEYIVASDVSAGLGGSGSSNSTISVLNRRTGRKAAAFATPTIDRHTLAELAIALCHWFVNYRGDPAFLIWEDNGYGMDVRDRVERSGFQNYYRRKVSKDAHLHARHSDKGGYWTVKRSRLLGPYMEALVEGHFDNQDRTAIEELRQYQLGTDGEPYHVGEKDKADPSGAGAAHGDRVVADALAWHASVVFGDYMQSRGRSSSKANVMNARDGNVPRHSFAWRRAKYLEMQRKQKRQSTW